jgi:UDP-glucose 4-epimerase
MRILAGERPIIFGTGEQTRDFTYVDDIARGLLLAAECDALVGESVNLGHGCDVSVGTVCRLILQKLDRPDLEPIFVPNGSPPDRDRAVIHVRKAGQLFGFSATVDIDEGLDRYLQWISQQDLDLKSWLEQDRTLED